MMASYSLYRAQQIGQTVLIKLTRKRCSGYSQMKPYIEGKVGLEFGGPSSIFSANHLIPVYNVAASIDNCNFSQTNLWTTTDSVQRFGGCLRNNFIADAANPAAMPSNTYDFVLASHVLEHVANPLRALWEWKRVLKPLGAVVVVLPHKANTFDHRRPFTTFEHIKADFDSNTSEEDLTHIGEILRLHDLNLDRRAGSPEQFKQRCLQNSSHRAMHHHVFAPRLLAEMFEFLAMEVVSSTIEKPYHLIMHARKTYNG